MANLALIALNICLLASQIECKCPTSCACLDTSVDCANRRLGHFPRDLPYRTEIVNLSNNALKSLQLMIDGEDEGDLAFAPINLTIIDLSSTSLTHFHSDFFVKHFDHSQKLNKSVEVLQLVNNGLREVPLINSIAHLHQLSLSSNRIQVLENVNLNNHYPQIESLDVSRNSIRHLKPQFLTSRSLEELDLSENKIEIIEENAFSLLGSLGKLILANNNLTSLRKNHFGKLSSLKTLDLSNNKLTQLDSLSFSKLTSLQVLKLRKNKIYFLEDGSFFGLANLHKLNLDHNEIINVADSWTFGLEGLVELSLRHNAIATMKRNAWKPMSKLVELNLAHNQLSTIDSNNLEHLLSLKVLKLSSNRISLIDENSFRQVSLLENLDLSNNEISWTIESPNSFLSSLSALKRLRLDNNRIKLIVKQTFVGLDKLTMLNLSSNPISSIQEGSFAHFDALKVVHMKDVDLNCDCSLKWLHHWLGESDTRQQHARSITCQLPPEMNRKTRFGFLSASADDFKCQELLKPYLLDDFSSSEKPVSAIKNENLTLYCKAAASGFEPVEFDWLKNKRILNISNRIEFKTIASSHERENVTHYTNIFTIHNVQDDDEGQYMCMASNRFGTVYSKAFEVNAHVVPYFLKQPHNVTVKVGNTARLECAAKGQPSPTISWKKDGGDNFPAAMERRMHVMPADDVFFIVEVKRSDMGLYSCTASNDAGFVISTAHVMVFEEPSFVRKMIDKKVVEGATAELECLATGYPLPKIVWLKNGEPLKPTDRHYFTAFDQLLFIMKMTAEDRGQYSCQLSNEYGRVSNSFYIDVVKKMELENEKDGTSLVKYVVQLWDAFIVYIHSRSLIIIIFLSIVLTSMVWAFCLCFCSKKKHSTKEESDGDVERENHLKTSSHSQLHTNLMKHYKHAESTNSSSSERDTGIEESCKSLESEGEEMFVYNTPSWHMSEPQHVHRSLPRSHAQMSIAPTASVYSSLPRRAPQSSSDCQRKATIRSQRTFRHKPYTRYDEPRLVGPFQTHHHHVNNPYASADTSEV